jgi:hypothetical protein
MKQHAMMHPPYRRDDAQLVRGGESGMYWQVHDGMVVRLAAREDHRRYLPLEPRQLEACAPEGGVVYAAAHDAAQAQRRDVPTVGAVGLAMALWMRLFADTA